MKVNGLAGFRLNIVQLVFSIVARSCVRMNRAQRWVGSHRGHEVPRVGPERRGNGSGHFHHAAERDAEWRVGSSTWRRRTLARAHSGSTMFSRQACANRLRTTAKVR